MQDTNEEIILINGVEHKLTLQPDKKEKQAKKTNIDNLPQAKIKK